MKAQPLLNRIIIRQIESEDITPGGIVIPDAAKEKPLEGRVEAVGSEVKELKVGQKVAYSKYAGTELSLKDGDTVVAFLILSEEDVLAILS